ncbi:hypothetical protein [Streptomyces wedmorensis]
MPLDRYKSPCPGGYQIHVGDMPVAGTLGARVMWGVPAKDVVITAGHVVNNPNASVFQPGGFGAPGEVHRIGRVAERSARRTYRNVAAFVGSLDDSPESRISCHYDFASIDVANYPTETSYRIPEINEADHPLDIRDPREGEWVQWLGMSTGIVRKGQVKDVSFWMPRSLDPTNVVNEQFFSVYPLTLIEVHGNMPTREGDSGAAVVAVTDRNIVGIHCFGATNRSGKPFTVASRIPASPQALTNGTSSISFEEVNRWIARTKAWRNS